jgi:hypothetical protein
MAHRKQVGEKLSALWKWLTGSDVDPENVDVPQIVHKSWAELAHNESIAGDSRRPEFNMYRSIVGTLKKDHGTVVLYGVDKKPKPTAQWAKRVQYDIGQEDRTIEFFFEAEYDKWLSACSDEFREKCGLLRQHNSSGDNQTAVKAAGANSQLTSIVVDLKAHAADGDLWDNEGFIDQRFMYADRHATEKWVNVREYSEYELYTSCLKLTDKSKEKIPFESLSSIVFLGAGSPNKDWKIINYALEKSENDLEIYICDASFYMLIETIDELQRKKSAISDINKRNRINIHARCLDFTDKSGWRRCGPIANNSKLFVIFGGTFGNLDEKRAFDALKDLSGDGDWFLIAGSFYQSIDHLNSDCDAHLSAQYDDSAREIVISSIRHLIDSKNPALSFEQKKSLVKIDRIKVDASADDINPSLPRRMTSSVTGTRAAVFSIKGDLVDSFEGEHHQDHIYLFSSKRYARPEFVASFEKILSCKYVDEAAAKSATYPFYHLLFRKEVSR